MVEEDFFPADSVEPSVMSDDRQSWSPRSILALILGGLLVWGLYVAAGVIWYGLNPLGGVVVLACVGIFVGFWLLLLRTQKKGP